jgi:hypothetical protein
MNEAAGDFENAVGRFAGQRGRSGRDNGGAKFPSGAAKQIREAAQRVAFQGIIEFLHEEDGRFMHEAPRERGPILGIGGKIIDGGFRDIAQPHKRENLLGTAARLFRADLGNLKEGHGDVFDHGERTQQKRRCKYKSEASRAEFRLRFRRERADWNSRENHIAGVGRFEEAEEAKEHMLSALRFAEHRVKAGRPEGYADLAERGVFVSDACDFTKLEGRMRGRVQSLLICGEGGGVKT